MITQDDNSLYICKELEWVFEIDMEMKKLYIYDYMSEEIALGSKAILLKIDKELGNKISEYFKVDISEYGVKLSDEKPSEMNIVDKKQIKNAGAGTILFSVTTAISIFLVVESSTDILFDTGITNENLGLLLISSITLFVCGLCLLLTKGDKAHVEEQIKKELKYNIKKQSC